jgi:N-acetylneuraminic acid mutarotase
MTVRGFMSAIITATLLVVVAPGPLSGPAQATAPATGDGQWRRLSTVGAGPSERSAPAVTGIGARVYVFGGVFDVLPTGVNTFFDDTHRLDTRTLRWVRLPTPGPRPPARAFAAATAHRPTARMFLFGGSTFTGDGAEFNAFGDLWVFNTHRNTWRQLDPVNAGPSPRSGPAMWTVGNTLYLFGGIDATFTTRNDLWAYHIGSNRWEQISMDGDPSAPSPRHATQAGQIAPGRVLTVYGGEGLDATGFTMFPDTWQYDLAAGAWSDITQTPTIDPPRNYGAAGVIGDALYLHGGDMPGAAPGCGSPFPNNPADELWRLDLATGQWRQLAPAGDPLPALKRHAAAVVRGSMYVVGGWDFQCEAGQGPGQVWNLAVYAFTP